MADSRTAQFVTIGALIVWVVTTFLVITMPQAAISQAAAPLATIAMVAFCLVHSVRRFAILPTVIMFVIAIIVANIYENMSIMTGFPFGSYVHTSAFGPKLFHVPLLVGPIFYSVSYIAWTLATMILGQASSSPDRLRLFGTPIVAAFIVVGWDICSDPIGATTYRLWIFADSGAYFGVPLANFLGWFLCTWTIFQLWQFYLTVRAVPARRMPLPYWYEAAVFWGAMGLQYPVMLLANPVSQTVTDTGGWAWRSGDILQAAVMMGIYTMLMAAVTAALAVTVRERPAIS